eukprot:3008495-Pyramimonas_sp.AAC.1
MLGRLGAVGSTLRTVQNGSARGCNPGGPKFVTGRRQADATDQRPQRRRKGSAFRQSRRREPEPLGASDALPETAVPRDVVLPMLAWGWP